MKSEQLAVVILAAGQGTRMKSKRVKVLHEIGGAPMLAYPLALAKALRPERLVTVVGRDAASVQQHFAGESEFVVQQEQRGTGHAVLCAQAALSDFQGAVLILYGDTPLLRPESISEMLAFKQEKQADLVVLAARFPLPGRIKRDAAGKVIGIVEMTDASEEETQIEEGNTGVYLLRSDLLWDGLSQVDDNNAQGEIYLTDIVAHAVRDGRRVEAHVLEDANEALGVNNRSELALAESVWRKRHVDRHLAAGVTFIDPDSTYIGADVEIGVDTVIEPGCVISGPSRIAEGVHIKAYSVIEASKIEEGAVVGPMAHLRPGSHLESDSKVGNFVEIKNSRLGVGSKANHLTYVGDSDVGDQVNLGCGVVTVNYDGQEKHRTTIEDGAFVGCNANLIAPVRVGANSYVAAGSTLTKDLPPDALAVARERQRNIEGWGKRRASKDKKG